MASVGSSRYFVFYQFSQIIVVTFKIIDITFTISVSSLGAFFSFHALLLVLEMFSVVSLLIQTVQGIQAESNDNRTVFAAPGVPECVC